MNTGYWINLCFDIQAAWDYCEPGSDKYKQIQERDDIPDYEQCDVNNEEEDKSESEDTETENTPDEIA